MTLDELKDKLKEILKVNDFDEEKNHRDADMALLDFINDDEVSDLFDEIKWYA